MTRRGTTGDGPALTSIGPRRGLGSGAIVAGLIVVAALGALGRLVPPPAERTPLAAAATPTPETGVRLVSPFSNVLYLRTTEIAVRGTAPAGVRQLDALVVVGRRSIGEARIDVDTAGRFSGRVTIVPPAARSVGVLEVRDTGALGRLLAEVTFAVEAGGLVLPADPSPLRGKAGSTLVVDVLVYGPLREIRGLLTSVDGRLIATGSTPVGPRVAEGGWPRTLGLSIEIPLDRLPDRARLHLLAIDPAGNEVEHIDVNVALSKR